MTQKFETLSDGVNITGSLKVNGSTFSSSSDKIEEGNSFAEVLDTGSNGIFRFLAENNEVFRITTDGKIGLGQTANSFPTSRFEIRENAVGFTTSLLITNLNPTNQNNLILFLLVYLITFQLHQSEVGHTLMQLQLQMKKELILPH